MTTFLPTDGIRSRLEWNASLNPAAAPLPTEDTKFFRKVRPRSPRSPCSLGRACSRDRALMVCFAAADTDVHYRDYRCVFFWLQWAGRSRGADLCIWRTGPNINTVEKLADLRRAGVNIGECLRSCIVFAICVLIVARSAYELFARIV